jgi:hypothetical protein
LKIVSKTEKDNNKTYVNAVFVKASSTNTLKGASVKAIAPAASDIVVQAKSQVAVVDEFPV